MTPEIVSLATNVELRRQIAQVPYFRESAYSSLDPAKTLDYFHRRFAKHIRLSCITPETVIADVGCGFGWLAMSMAAFTPAKVVAVEADTDRLRAAATIAALLGLGGRIEWRTGRLEQIPLADREADVTYCVEVLEHVQRDRGAFAELERVTGRYLVLTTPNAAFPMIMHDTCLPFCHWLPMSGRNAYAALFGRRPLQHSNRFWAPWEVTLLLPHFRRVSKFLHFESVDDYFQLYPYYLPYVGAGTRVRPSTKLMAYYRFASLFGGASHYVMQSLAGTFERRS